MTLLTSTRLSIHSALPGTLALDALHRQILPFVLRRTKEAVLTDLPPKIVQDYLCDLSPLQALLYEGFDANADEGTDTARPDEHVFQRLMRERKLLNHPSGALALASDAAKSEADKWLRDNKCTLNGWGPFLLVFLSFCF